jgi:hypothetical protein
MRSVCARELGPLFQRWPLFLHDDPGVRNGQLLDPVLLRFGEPGGEVVDLLRADSLVLRRLAGGVELLPDEEEREPERHAEHHVERGVDRARSGVVLHAEGQRYQALREHQPREGDHDRDNDDQETVEDRGHQAAASLVRSRPSKGSQATSLTRPKQPRRADARSPGAFTQARPATILDATFNKLAHLGDVSWSSRLLR